MTSRFYLALFLSEQEKKIQRLEDQNAKNLDKWLKNQEKLQENLADIPCQHRFSKYTYYENRKKAKSMDYNFLTREQNCLICGEKRKRGK